MAYEAHAESVRLLEGLSPSSSARLSRRVRHRALAVDRDGDVAATMFLRRGVSGGPQLDVWTLELEPDGWRLLGGGSAPWDQASTDRRPTVSELGAAGISDSGGSTARSVNPGASARLRFVRWAQLATAAEVVSLRVGSRPLRVAAHGLAVVVWTSEPPAVIALDEQGDELGPVAIRVGASRLPPIYRDR